MSDDRLFYYYKRGWNRKIVAKGRAGWIATGIWFLPFGILALLYSLFMPTLGANSSKIAATILFLAATAVWCLLMFRWQIARADIIDLDRRDGAKTKGK